MSARPKGDRSAALRWALRRRCPACGARIFDSWVRIRRVCSGCGLLTDRGEHDYFLGAVLLNLVLAESIPVVVVLVIVAFTAPDPPWTVLLWGGLGLAVAAPVVGYPFSKTLWLCADMQFREPVYRAADGEGTSA